ncbi:tetratricopeptide repeat protein [Pseudovibrio sp. Tun.PSC04-5.I4]|uniref:tetratricopeptide repeat protein n=1 Tax=Pseudovibrio sp. Tun.PSC04-5.I4 TaxID=1798213 RepID=UPI0008803E02|nr:tetratricopeptide repeat protein [Pseudovibrio sp. Tun.PSC04-5.I4]SDR37910.1 Tetratricopeptide repeat-containing protein [Pseudovibrio sp. Tun.PSC04-5.I4]
MKLLKLILISMTALLLFLSSSWAMDKFGQDVSPELEAKTLLARMLRQPFRPDTYDPKKSVEQLLEVVESKADYFRAYFNLGLAYHELDDYPNAKAAFNKAIIIRHELNIEDTSVVNTAGWVAMKHGDFSHAEGLLKQAEALTINEESFTKRATISNLGELYFLTQRFEEAERYLTRSLQDYGNEAAQYYLDVIAATQKLEKNIAGDIPAATPEALQ